MTRRALTPLMSALAYAEVCAVIARLVRILTFDARLGAAAEGLGLAL